MLTPGIQRVESAPLRYLLAEPEAAGEDSRPVLCFLHGYDEAAPMPIERALTLHGPLRPGNPATARSDFVVVAPQLPIAGDLWHRFGDAVREIVHEVQAHHRGDPDRTYLTGFSFGGNGVFDLALLQPDLWAALWAVDPTRPPPRDPEMPAWLSSGEISRRRQAAFVQSLRLAPAAAEPAGDRVFEDAGLDHVGTAARAYADTRIYEWLLARRRPAAD